MQIFWTKHAIAVDAGVGDIVDYNFCQDINTVGPQVDKKWISLVDNCTAELYNQLIIPDFYNNLCGFWKIWNVTQNTYNYKKKQEIILSNPMKVPNLNSCR